MEGVYARGVCAGGGDVTGHRGKVMNTTEHGTVSPGSRPHWMYVNKQINFCSIFGVFLSVNHRHLTPIIEMVPKPGKKHL